MEINFKRFLSLMLALVMVIGMFPVTHVHVHAEEVTYRLLEKVTSVEAGEQYVFFFGDNRAVHGSTKGWSKGTGLDSGGISNKTQPPSDNKYLWTLESDASVEGGFKIRNVGAGTYVKVWQNNANLVSSEEANVFTFTHTNDGFVIKANDVEYGYFNNLGGENKIGGWNTDGTKFDLYKVVNKADPYGKLRGLWTKVSVDTETTYNAKEGKFEYAWDNNPDSHWHSNWNGASDKLNGSNTFTGVIDLGQAYTLNRFYFTPRVDKTDGEGAVTQASLYVRGSEAADWVPATEHATFASDNNTKTISFPTQSVRYVKFVAEKAAKQGWVTVSEFDVGYEAPAECEHSYTEETIKEPTCVDGQKKLTCTLCGDSKIEAIPATGAHTPETIPAVDPTLDTVGKTEGTRCSVCGHILVAQTDIPATYNDGIVPKSAVTLTAGTWEQNGGANEGGAELAWDDNFGTMWHTNWGGTTADKLWIQFELNANYEATALRYKPRAGAKNGTATKYQIQISHDGTNFAIVKEGNWEATDSWKVAEFDAHNAKYVRLVVVEFVTDQPAKKLASAAEIRLVGTPVDHEHSFTTETVAATCAAEGSTTITCECGDTHTFKIPATGEHEYDNACDTTCNECDATREVGAHQYTNEYDSTCNICGATRDVKEFTSEQITGVTGEANAVDTNDGAGAVSGAFDGNDNTHFATPAGGNIANCYLIANLGGEFLINQVAYTSRNSANAVGNLKNLTIWVKNGDGEWLEVASTTEVANPGTTTITFDAVEATQVKLTSTESCHWQSGNVNKVMAVAEFEVFKAVCLDGEHTWNEGEETTAPGCGSTGVKTYTCSVCGSTKTEPIPATGEHSFTTYVSDGNATCAVDGTKTAKCDNCDATDTIADEGSATGEHTWGEGVVTTNPGCESEGVKTYTCSVCKDTKTEPVAATGHDYKAVVTAPDCVNGGYTTYTCDCGDSYVADETTALGHKYESEYTAPDFGKDGYTTYTCSVCGDSYVETDKGTAKVAAAEVGGVKYATLAEAVAAAEAVVSEVPETVTLLANVELTERLTIARAYGIRLDLNGYTISGKFDDAFGMIYVKKGATLTFAGTGIIDASESTSCAIGNYGWIMAMMPANVTIKGGNHPTYGEQPGVYNFYYDAETYGWATFASDYVIDKIWNCGYLSIDGATVDYLDNSGSLNVMGGTINELIARDGSDAPAVDGAGTITIANPDSITVFDEDYKLEEIQTGVYKVVPKTYVAEANGTKYETLAEAVAVGGEVKLLADVVLDTYLNVTTAGKITLDLAGFSITRDGNTGIYVNNADTVLTITGEGSVSAEQAVWAANGTVKIMNGTYYGTGDAIYTTGNGHIEIYGGNFSAAETDHTANKYVVLNQKDDARETSSITVYGGTFEGFNPANNYSEGASTNFVAEGYCSREEDGFWTVYEGHNWVNADCVNPKTCSACGATEGTALGHTPAEAVKENEVAPTLNSTGSYDLVVYCSVCKTHEISRETVTVDALTGAVAAIDGYNYATLAEAVAAAEAGATVTLLKNANGDGIIIDKDITIDLDGYTYTIDGTLVGSTGTKSCGFQILEDNVVVIKDGAIVMDENAVRGHDNKVGNNFVIQNYADLTLENVAVTGNSNTSYVVSINSGDVAMTGTTSITAKKDGAVAFDVCEYASYAAPVVTVNTTGTIDGNIEVTGGELALEAATVNGALTYTAGKVTKAETVTLAAPEDYKWADNGELVEAGLSGSGTQEDPFMITNLEELILFRDSVNAGETVYNADGVYVALGANIDMASVDWSVNIGDDCNATFDGIFDGKGFTISNLNSTETAAKADGYVCAGLFGAIYGNAVVKNLTIENANINTGNFVGNNAAVVVGFAYKCTGSVENVTVKNSTINATGITGTGAIVGYTYYGSKLNVIDCSVEKTDITGAAYVGGIIGYAAPNCSIVGCSVTDATINATSCAAGGIAGIIVESGNITGASVKNAKLTSAHQNWQNAAGAVVGTITHKVTVTAECEEITINGAESDTLVGSVSAEKPVNPVAKIQARIGNTYYTTLAEAVKAAKANDTITLLADVVLDTYLNVTTAGDITLDLAGFSITRDGNTGIYVNNADTVLTITGEGSVSAEQAVWAANGTVKIMNGTYYGTGDAIYTTGNGHIEIYGGSFSAKDGAGTQNEFCVLNQNDAARDTSSITVYGGTFKGFNPADNVSEGADTNFVAEGYCSREEDGSWTVVEGHNWVDADCDTPKTCSACGATEGTAPGHTPAEAVKENEKDATCTDDGSYDSVVYCSECDAELSRVTNTVTATGHTAGEAVKENEKPATCGAEGSYESVTYCSECDTELDRETIPVSATGNHTAGEPVKEHETETGYDLVVYCSVCGTEMSRETITNPVETAKVVMKSMNVLLEDEIKLTYTIAIPEELVNAGASVVLIKDGAYKYVEKTFAGENLISCQNADGNYVVEMGVASGEMTCPITVKVLDAEGAELALHNSKNEVLGTPVAYSVVDYAGIILNGNSKSEVKALANALVVYGGYAQTNFDTFTETLAYDALNIVPDLSSVTATTVDQYKSGQTNANIGVKANGINAYLDSNIFMRVYMKVEGDIAGYSFTLTTPTGVQAVTPVYDSASNRYYVDITGIASAYIDYTYTVTATKIASGETNEITTSVLSYVRTVLNGNYTEKLQNLVKAIYLYNQAANANWPGR